MANKYSEISDFEVNKLVAECLFKNTRYDVDSENGRDVKLLFKNQLMDTLTYANNYAAAFKLMIDNEIGLEKIRTTGSWKASSQIVIHNLGYPMIVFTHQKTPCRAIAETFLLMKDAEKE